MLCPIYRSAQRYPNHPALIFDNGNISYQDLNKIISYVANKLKEQQPDHSKVLLILCKDNLNTIILMWSAIRAGITVCTLNPLFTLDQILKISDNLGTNWIYADNESWQKINFKESINSQRKKIFLRCSIDLLAKENLKDPLNLLNCAKSINSNFNKLSPLSLDLKLTNSKIKVNENNIANLTLTSGSTGCPKAVALTLRNHIYSAIGSQLLIPLNTQSRYLQSLPLYHVGGFAVTIKCFLKGASIVLTSKFNLKDELTTVISNFAITHLSLVPTQVYRLLNQGFSGNNTTLKYLLIGGGSITSNLLKKCINAHINPFISYGLSEMASQVATKKVCKDEDIYDLNAGKVLPFRTIKIENEEILVKGKTLFAGYYQKDQIIKPFDALGYFHTGDRGKICNHNLYYLGRIDCCFKSGGEKIQPEKIERVLAEFFGLDENIVVGVPDDEWGYRTVAIVKNKIPDNIKEDLKKYLSNFEIPKNFIPWPNETLTGLKIKRTKMLSYAIDFLKKGGK